ncbi:MAG: response regulator, partial [Candidatus Eisenbacteria bacterium]
LRTGWDLGERLASDPETRHIPFVFVTGFDQQVRDRLQNNVFAQRPKHLVKPIDGATLVAAIEEVVGAIGSRQVRILMADDDASVAAFVRKVLPEGRFHLDLASNGEECLHILRTQPRGFDLLLLDLMMPGVSGYDVLRQMALSGTSASLPVLVLTNYPEPRTDEERQLLEHGMVLDIVSKTAVHENPSLLAHVVEWHVEVAGDREGLEEAA